jgi:glucose-6-phosphate dehydrogenase assembly protein OpcA
MNFSVDRDFVRVGDKSYAINKINSVEVRSEKKKGSTAYLALWAVAAAALLMGIQAGAAAAAVGVCIALFCGIAGYGSFGRRIPTMSYTLYLVTSSSEAAAVTTTNRGEIDRVRSEIEGAIAARA